MVIALTVALSVTPLRSFSSAPHWARVMMAGWRAAAEADPGGAAWVRPSSAGEVPGSMVLTSSPGGVAPVAVSTRTWMPVAPLLTSGVVPTRAPAASAVMASGPSSVTASFSHAVQPLASFRRTFTITSLDATAEVRDQETPATVNLAVVIFEVRTSGPLTSRPVTCRVRAAAAGAGVLGKVASSTWSRPLMAVLTTLGATGSGGSAKSNATVGTATKDGVSATARAAETSLMNLG